MASTATGSMVVLRRSADVDDDAVAVPATRADTRRAGSWRCRSAGRGCERARSAARRSPDGCGSSTWRSSSWERPSFASWFSGRSSCDRLWIRDPDSGAPCRNGRITLSAAGAVAIRRPQAVATASVVVGDEPFEGRPPIVAHRGVAGAVGRVAVDATDRAQPGTVVAAEPFVRRARAARSRAPAGRGRADRPRSDRRPGRAVRSGRARRPCRRPCPTRRPGSGGTTVAQSALTVPSTSMPSLSAVNRRSTWMSPTRRSWSASRGAAATSSVTSRTAPGWRSSSTALTRNGRKGSATARPDQWS